MNQPTLSDLESLARAAGKILYDGYETDHDVQLKGVIDLVTEIDHKSEKFLLEEIQCRWPSSRFVAEESGESGSGELTWYIDPLDGTVNYAHGVPIFCMSIACAWEGQTRLAAVYDPMRDEMFSAERGRGAQMNARPLQVTRVAELRQALLVTGFPYNTWTAKVNNLEYFGRFARMTQGVRRLGSAALDICYVAAGRFDGYWELSLQPWDLAAGGLIAEEAGARVTNLQGGDDYLSPPPSVLAAGPSLHGKMLEVLDQP
ncbi:MAG: inositol monophosphatase [Anaerolineaceae bacterium]|nr:MAG: inositol monophosphatase [Anaerolineaceae bacterium]